MTDIKNAITTAARRSAFEIFKTIRQTSLRIALAPIHLFTRRDPRLWVIVGKGNCQFDDNAKYFYCWLTHNASDSYRIYYLISNSDQAASLQSLGGRTCSPESFRSRLLLLRVGTVAIDSKSPLIRKIREWYRGARLVQLWHGIGLKTVEHGIRDKNLSRLPNFAQQLVDAQSYLANDFLHYDYFISTSNFYTEKVFKPAVRARHFVNACYPRHDYLVNSSMDNNRMTFLNVDNNSLAYAADKKAEGWKVVLYTPTFRDNALTPFDENVLDVDALESYCRDRKIVFLIKLHPMAPRIGDNRAYTSIRLIDHSSDIYPILKITDVLITDYSSIASDFLLLDRPIIYFPYDLERYMHESRGPMFDYDEMTPGPKCKTFTELCGTLDATLFTENADTWSEKRAELRELAFDDFNGGASEALWEILA
jgi:CDP-glycerol glycerophosphotransferase (TagB/SpsB family)